jgi:hypothetical protein
VAAAAAARSRGPRRRQPHRPSQPPRQRAWPASRRCACRHRRPRAAARCPSCAGWRRVPPSVHTRHRHSQELNRRHLQRSRTMDHRLLQRFAAFPLHLLRHQRHSIMSMTLVRCATRPSRQQQLASAPTVLRRLRLSQRRGRRRWPPWQPRQLLRSRSSHVQVNRPVPQHQQLGARQHRQHL